MSSGLHVLHCWNYPHLLRLTLSLNQWIAIVTLVTCLRVLDCWNYPHLLRLTLLLNQWIAIVTFVTQDRSFYFCLWRCPVTIMLHRTCHLRRPRRRTCESNRCSIFQPFCRSAFNHLSLVLVYEPMDCNSHICDLKPEFLLWPLTMLGLT